MPTLDWCLQCGAEISVKLPQAYCTRCLFNLGIPVGEDVPATPEGTDGGAAGSNEPLPGADPAPQDSIRRFGDYELLEEIARGGMGVVYRARQVSLNRIVAVKVILAGQFASRERMLRFRVEAERAAQLQHPNIVAIHETGEQEGQPYFSMDYLAGGNLAALVREKSLSARSATQLVRTLAEAVHYAHGQGILHRDLKPSNILLDAAGQPRIADFGLARRVEKDSFLTVTGQVLGSPSFMPPEQAGAKLKAGRHSDVYALGGILFYLLTGRPPFLAESVPETLQQVLNTEPVSPRLLNPGVPEDLATVCLKCLEKDPGKRYATARELAEDLARFLRREPVQARPVGRPEKIWRWCRRKPALAGSLAVALVLFLAVAIGSPIAAMRIAAARDAERHERQRAEDLRKRTEDDLYARQIRLAQQDLDDHQRILARELLRGIDASEHQRALRGWEWRYLAAQSQSQEIAQLPGHNAWIAKVAFSPDDALLASISEDGEARLWDWRRRRLIHAWQAHRHPKSTKNWNSGHSLAFSPDGATLATGGSDGTVQLWDVGTRQPRATLRVEWQVTGLDFSPQGTLLAAATLGGKVIWWDLTGAQPEWLGEAMGDHFAESVAFTADGRELWLATLRGTKHLDLTDPRRPVEMPKPPDLLAVSSDRQWLVSLGEDTGRFQVWNPSTREVQATLPEPPHWHVLAISPDRGWIACGDTDGNVTLLNVTQGNVTRVLHGHEACVLSVAFAHRSGALASGGEDKVIRLWDYTADRHSTVVQAHRRKVQDIKFLKDSGRFVTAGEELLEWETNSWRHSTVKLWEMAGETNGAILVASATNAGPVGHQWVSVLADQKRVTANGDSGGEFSPRTVRVFSLPELTSVSEIVGSHLTQSEDGSLIVHSLTNRLVRRANLDKAPQRIGELTDNIYKLALSPDGKIVAATEESESNGGVITFWDTAGGRPPVTLQEHEIGFHMLAFSPDSHWLASASWDYTVGLWDAAVPRLGARLKGHRDQVNCVAFSPDNKTLASGSSDRTVRLWHVRTGRELLVLPSAVDDIWSVAFSPDGQWLLAGGYTGKIQFWRAPSFAELEPDPAFR